MVSYFFACGQVTGMVAVLILVVVDNGLVHLNSQRYAIKYRVLILVVVDNGLVLDLIRHY